MKLTLLNQCGVSLTYSVDKRLGMKWWSSKFVNVTPPDLLNRRSIDFMEKNLVWSKITDSNKVSAAVFLFTSDGKEGEFVRVTNVEEDDCNIWKQLLKTFGGKVKISVDIRASAQSKETEESQGTFFVAQDGLVIQPSSIGYFCEEKAVRINDFNLNKTRFDITVIADISDDHEVIRQAKEKVSVPLKTTRRILEEGVDSNVVITAGNGVEIKSHKNFLIASSAVIERMFANEMEESKTGRVDMTDLSEEGVKAFLRFIYCGDRIEPEADLDLAFELLYASHKYEVSQLEEFMTSYWIEMKDANIDVKIAFKTYMFVRGIEDASQIKAKMLRILHRKYGELKALQEYKDLYKNPSGAMELCEDFLKILDVKTN